MKRKLMLAPLAMLATFGGTALADSRYEKHIVVPGYQFLDSAAFPKAASTSTVASRAYTSSSNTVYGGFELAQASTVYILVRGNSLGSLGITNGYLDAPHVRLFNQAGADLITQGGYSGFNDCNASDSTDLPVVNYYSARGIPVQSRDTCLAASLPSGAYTFTVTPSFLNSNNSLRSSGSSGPSAGEILFEVKLNP
jgi:hypothetical protein